MYWKICNENIICDFIPSFAKDLRHKAGLTTEYYLLNVESMQVCLTGSLVMELTALETLQVKESVATCSASSVRVLLFPDSNTLFLSH